MKLERNTQLIVNKLQSGKNNRHINSADCRLLQLLLMGFHVSLAQQKIKVVIKKKKKKRNYAGSTAF